MKEVRFPDGQPHLTLSPYDYPDGRIKMNITCAEDLLRLSMVNNVLRRRGINPTLEIGYLMGSRLERAISDNDPITLRCVAQAINAMGFNHVVVNVPHETKELHTVLRNSISHNKLLWDIVDNTVNRIRNYQIGTPDNMLLIAPDKGAEFRARECANILKLPVMRLEKERDSSTGKLDPLKITCTGEIYHPEAENPFPGFKNLHLKSPIKHVILVDDLCDGGRTFINAVEFLKKEYFPNWEVNEVKFHLCVAHAIFSAGAAKLVMSFNSINVSDTYPFKSDSFLEDIQYINVTHFETNL